MPKRNPYFKKYMKSFIMGTPFIGVRLNVNLLIIKPVRYQTCFFVNNQGLQVANPENGKVEHCNIEIWTKKTESKKQFEASRNLDKDFLENVIRRIWVITENMEKEPKKTPQ